MHINMEKNITKGKILCQMCTDGCGGGSTGMVLQYWQITKRAMLAVSWQLGHATREGYDECYQCYQLHLRPDTTVLHVRMPKFQFDLNGGKRFQSLKLCSSISVNIKPTRITICSVSCLLKPFLCFTQTCTYTVFSGL